ncbi:MAG: hypothetical protein FJ100_10275 [Deltaproteobacteria bacterium]|nr:hypothetical protein [Deltaproteobacteria bacterium]
MRFHWFSLFAFTCIAAAPADAADAPPSADPAADPAKDIALLDGVIKAKARDKAAVDEVAKAFVRMAQLQTAKGDAKAANATRERMVEWYDAQGHPKDGGPLATLVAEARFRGLEPAVAAELARKLVHDGKVAADARKHLDGWLDALGAQVKWATPAPPTKDARAQRVGKPLIDSLLALRAYGALPWTRAGHLSAGRLLMAVSQQVAAWAALEAADKQADLVEASRQLRDQAAEVWERSWKESDVAGQRDNWALQIRKELAQIKPAEYPDIDKAAEETLTPQQQEASRLATLAQRTDNAQLKVLYLRKATNLDPSNTQLKELLKQAEAELAGKAKP